MKLRLTFSLTHQALICNLWIFSVVHFLYLFQSYLVKPHREKALQLKCSFGSNLQHPYGVFATQNHSTLYSGFLPKQPAAPQTSKIQHLDNPIYQADSVFNIVFNEPKGVDGKFWRKTMLQEKNRFLYYYKVYMHGTDFMKTITTEEWQQLIKQLETPRKGHSKDILLNITKQKKSPEDLNSPFGLSVKEWVARLNRYAGNRLGFSKMDQETFLVQYDLRESLQELDFERIVQKIKQLMLLDEKHRKQLWKRMQDIKGFQHPLHMAVVLQGDLSYPIVKLFLNSGAYVDQRDEDGRTPLIRAAIQGKALLTEFLLTQGARVDLTDMYGFSALHYASEKGHVETVMRLLLYGANPHSPAAPRYKWETPLHVAINHNVLRYYETVQTLMRYERFELSKEEQRLGKSPEPPYLKVVATQQADLLQLLFTPSSLNRYSAWRQHTLSSKHILFQMAYGRFPEKNLLPVLEIEIQNKNANLLCATTDEKGHTLFWWACKLAYPRMLHRLLDFFAESTLEKYPGYTMCDPHKLDDRGYAPIEMFVTYMIQHTWEEPELSSTARRILKFRGNSGAAFLTKALSGENTMRKAATITFASTTKSCEIIFNPPLTMGLDDLFLTIPTKMRVNYGRDLTPFLISVRNQRRRGQRLVMKAMLVSYESNVKVFRTLSQLWAGLVDAADFEESSSLMLMSKSYPFLIQDILSLISPGEVRTEQAIVDLVHLIPSNFLFESRGVSPLENSVWFGLSPLSSRRIPFFRALTSDEHILASTSHDCRAALAAIHQASLYFRRFRPQPGIWETLQFKKDVMIRILFSSPIFDIHDEVIITSHLVAIVSIMVCFALFVWFFLATRIPSVFFKCVDPCVCVPQSTENIWHACIVAFRVCILGNNSSTFLWTPSMRFIHRVWITLRLIVYSYVVTSPLFWNSSEIYQWPSLLAALVWLQSFFISYTVQSKTQHLLLYTLDYFDIQPLISGSTEYLTQEPSLPLRSFPALSLSPTKKACQSHNKVPFAPFKHLGKNHQRHTVQYVFALYPPQGFKLYSPFTTSINFELYPTMSRPRRFTSKLSRKYIFRHLNHPTHKLFFKSYISTRPATPCEQFHRILKKSLQKQIKTFPRDYFVFLHIIFLLVIISSLAPLLGITFLCNFIPVYRDTDLLETYRSAPFSAFFFESGLVFTTTTFLFRFFKPFLVVFIVIRQRLHLVHVLERYSPMKLKEKLNIDLEGADLWETTKLWTNLWHQALARSDSLWKNAKLILNSFAILCVSMFTISVWISLWVVVLTVFVAGFLRIFVNSQGGELLQTRLGLGILQLVTISMLLVTFCARESCSYNKALTYSWQWLETLYISSRFGTINHDILRNELINITITDTKEMQLLGIHVSNSYHRLIQLITLPAILLLLLTSIYNKAPYMYL